MTGKKCFNFYSESVKAKSAKLLDSEAGNLIVARCILYPEAVNSKGKVILDFEYKEIKMINADVKKQTVVDNNVFYAAVKDTKYMLYNSKGKRVDKTYYNEVIFDNEYPLFKASTEAYDYIITSKELSKISLTTLKKEYKAYDSHIVIDNNYYNYSGKLIYEAKTKE